jgi:hypothetical protein
MWSAASKPNLRAPLYPPWLRVAPRKGAGPMHVVVVGPPLCYSLLVFVDMWRERECGVRVCGFRFWGTSNQTCFSLRGSNVCSLQHATILPSFSWAGRLGYGKFSSVETMYSSVHALGSTRRCGLLLKHRRTVALESCMHACMHARTHTRHFNFRSYSTCVRCSAKHRGAYETHPLGHSHASSFETRT